MSDPLQEALARLNAGDPQGAAALASQAVEAVPENGGAWHLLGFASLLAGRPDSAVAALERAAALDPNRPDLYRHRADALQAAGRAEEAIPQYQHALKHAPEDADAHFNLARAFAAAGQTANAETSFREASRLNPADPEPLNGLGAACLMLFRPADALEALERAVALAPGFIDAAANRASALRQIGRLDEAIAAFQELAVRAPGTFAVDVGLAECWIQAGNLEAAAEAYGRAAATRPDAADIRYAFGQILLLQGDYPRGWAEFSHRFSARGAYAARRPFEAPQWDGSDLSGRTLLLWGEQGVGDEILFASMLPSLDKQQGRVLVECDPRFVPLFGRSFSRLAFVGRSDPPDPALDSQRIDIQCAVGDLGGFYRLRSEDFPASGGFLRPDTERVRALRERYEAAAAGRRIVGISWRSKKDRLGAVKSSELADWGPLLSRPDVLLVDLQYGETAEERAAATRIHNADILHDDDIDPLLDLDGFAAQVAALDTVVTTSNATAHFAGGLGMPTWLLLHAAIWELPWYWGQKIEAMPWYPSIRMLRQSPDESWPEVVARATATLGFH